MIASATPAIRNGLPRPAWWVFKHKLRALLGLKPYSMYALPAVRALRDGKVTAAELDALSTCERAGASAQNGLEH